MDGTDVKPPILLPDSVVVKTGGKEIFIGRRTIIDLVLKGAHCRVLHVGIRGTLSDLREKYWIIRGMQVIKRV